MINAAIVALIFNVSERTVLSWVNDGLPVAAVEPGTAFRPLFNVATVVTWWRTNKAESQERLAAGLTVNAEVLRDSVDGKAALAELYMIQSELIEIDADLKAADRRVLEFGVDVARALQKPEHLPVADLITDNTTKTIALRLGGLKMRMEIANRLIAKKLPDYKPVDQPSTGAQSPEEIADKIRRFVNMAEVADGEVVGDEVALRGES